MRFYQFGIFSFMFLAITACSSGDHWEGVVYPKKENLQINRSAGKFDSLEECKAGSMEFLKSMKAVETGYYICGKNCNAGLSHYNKNCEDIIRGNFYKE